MAGQDPSDGGLEALVQQMQHLKQEHRQLVELISADPGMAAETRNALLAHLLEEEDELMAKIAAKGGESAPRASSGMPRLTVGSLRADADQRSVTLGSLRRR